MELVQDTPDFSGSDRLGLTFFGSVLVHMIVILGVTFSLPEILPKLDQLPTLDITLVNTRSDETPEDADFLAQANQEGGGDHDDPLIARSPLPPTTLPTPMEVMPSAQMPHAASLNNISPIPDLLANPRPADKQINRPDPNPSEQAKLSISKAGLDKQQPQFQESKRLSAEISQFWEEYQKRPRRKFLSARTREYKYAAYMEAWRTKVERVGNLNYPEVARREKISGSLILDVALNADGSINEIYVRRASGNKLLDDAAIRIVKLASPFSPFPKNIKEDIDILHVTRTWQFMHGNRLVSR